MSQTRLNAAANRGRVSEAGSTGAGVEEVQPVLEALADPDALSILHATSDDQLTVNEISETVGLAQSTAYRKVDRLAEAGLLSESIQIRRSGSNASTYACRVADLHLALCGEEGPRLHVSRAEA